MADMMGKQVLFLAVDGFDASAFQPLWNCFGELNASVRIASYNAADQIKSMDGTIDTSSDMSFNEASVLNFAAIIIPDGKTADAMMSDDDAMALLKEANSNNIPIVAVDRGVEALISAGIVSDKMIVAPDDFKERLESKGATFSSDMMAADQNIFTAKLDADMMQLCNLVSDFARMRREEAA